MRFSAGMSNEAHSKIIQQLKSDISVYVQISDKYKEICQQSEISRDVAIKLRSQRQNLFEDKRLAAEDIFMCMLNFKSSAINEVGLTSFYEELIRGLHSHTIAFVIADKTVEYLKSII